MLYLLVQHKPHTSIEIGCAQGGSLQAISRFSERVFSLDLDESIPITLGSRFNNVEFIIGDSKTTLPQLVDRMNSEGKSAEFVFVDADHSEEGVRRDINALLKMEVKSRTLILMHDPFNPICRKGILSVDWNQCIYCHYVEVDFIPGVFFSKATPSAELNSMWGGLALAVLEPEPRVADLQISTSNQFIFDKMFPLSCHYL